MRRACEGNVIQLSNVFYLRYTTLDQPRTWYLSRWIAVYMGKDPRLVSAYMTRLFRMGLVERRRHKAQRRGRPAYLYRLTKRGREHARWLKEVYQWNADYRMQQLILQDRGSITWTAELDDEVRRFLRRQVKESDRRFWKTMLSVKRSEVLQDPMSLFEYDDEPRKRRGGGR